VPDNQPPAPTQGQRGKRGGRQRDARESRRREGRGDAGGTAVKSQITGVPTSYVGNFQM